MSKPWSDTIRERLRENKAEREKFDFQSLLFIQQIFCYFSIDPRERANNIKVLLLSKNDLTS